MAEIDVNDQGNPIWQHGHYYEVDLCWLVDSLKKAIVDIKNLQDQWSGDESQLAQLQKEVSALEQQLNDLQTLINTGGFSNEVLLEWANKNMPQLVANIVKYVFFGLSRDGHFVAYIPRSWDFIQFDTDMDHTSPTWGHLILRW